MKSNLRRYDYAAPSAIKAELSRQRVEVGRTIWHGGNRTTRRQTNWRSVKSRTGQLAD